MTALDSLRAVLAQAADEPADGIAIRTGVGPDVQFRGLTWGELRRVADLADGVLSGTAYQQIARQANRYLTAVYGPDVVYRAPETFVNLVERWLVFVAIGSVQSADKVMAEIERQAAGPEGGTS